MNTTGIYNETTTETHKPRRWPWVVGIVAALVIGATIGAAGQTEPIAQPDVEAISAEQDRVSAELDQRSADLDEREATLSGIAAEPNECREYAAWLLEQFDAKDAIVLDAFGEMADILDRDGYMVTNEYVSILDSATTRMNELTAEIQSGQDYECL
jgi:hypothetical protein